MIVGDIMRNPKRIAELLSLLEAIWIECPDIRFNQLINNLQWEYTNKTNDFRTVYEKEEFLGKIYFTPIRQLDLFHVEDENFIEFLKQKHDELRG